MERYSAAPIVCLDGPDSNGFRAELHVIKGLGTPKEEMSSESGKSVKYSFKVDNTRFSPGGWVPVDSDIEKEIESAINDSVDIEFRIEKKRNTKLDNLDDRKKPFSEILELAKTDKMATIRNIAGVKRVDKDNWVFSPFAVTNPELDPSSFGGGTSALNLSPEEIKALSSNQQKTPETSNRYSSKYSSMYKQNGELNAGSFGAGAPLSIMIFLNEYLREHDIKLKSEKVPGVSSPAKLGYYASVLTDKASRVEKVIDNVEISDLNSHAHSRARALIFEAIRIIGIKPEILESRTEEEKKETGAKVTFNEWADLVEKLALGIWKENLKIINNSEKISK